MADQRYTEFPARNFPKPGESIFAQKFPLREDGHSRNGGGENRKKNLQVANLRHDAKLKRIIEQKNYLYFLFFFRELKLVKNAGFFKIFKISFTPWKKIACFFDL